MQQPDAVISPAVFEVVEAVRLANRSLHRTMGMVGVTIRRIVIAGQKLLQQRGESEQGEWLEWLAANVPDITPVTARKWMKLAAFAQRSDQLDNAQSVTQAYKLAGLLPEGESGGSTGGQSRERSVLNGLTRLADELKTLTIERMGREDRLILRKRLQPYAALYEQLEGT